MKNSRIRFWLKYELSKYTAILFFIVLSIICLITIVILDKFDPQYNTHDILVEAHGVIFDLFVFGLLITIFEFLRNRKESRSRYNEEIEDLIGWKSEEAKVRILAKVKRLYELGQRCFYLSKSYLKNADLSNYDLTNSVIVFANINDGSFVRSNLKNVRLTASKMDNVYFTSTNLENADLSNSKCRGAYFTDTGLINTSFKNADLRKANFSVCNYDKVNFENAKLKGVKVDDPDWFETLIACQSIGIEELKKKYFVNPKAVTKDDGFPMYKIEKRKPAHNNGEHS